MATYRIRLDIAISFVTTKDIICFEILRISLNLKVLRLDSPITVIVGEKKNTLSLEMYETDFSWHLCFPLGKHKGFSFIGWMHFKD